METILIDVALAGIKGGVPAVGAFLSGMSAASWVTLGEGVAAELAPSVAAKLGLAHPSLDVLVQEIAKGVSGELASQAARAWFTANGDTAIGLQQGAGRES
jgi:hypothetical protein